MALERIAFEIAHSQSVEDARSHGRRGDFKGKLFQAAPHGKSSRFKNIALL